MIAALGPSAVVAQERQGDWGWDMHPMMWGMWGTRKLGMSNRREFDAAMSVAKRAP